MSSYVKLYQLINLHEVISTYINLYQVISSYIKLHQATDVIYPMLLPPKNIAMPSVDTADDRGGCSASVAAAVNSVHCELSRSPGHGQMMFLLLNLDLYIFIYTYVYTYIHVCNYMNLCV